MVKGGGRTPPPSYHLRAPLLGGEGVAGDPWTSEGRRDEAGEGGGGGGTEGPAELDAVGAVRHEDDGGDCGRGGPRDGRGEETHRGGRGGGGE